MNPDQKQLNVANEVLDTLSARFDDCVLAGGAPRDWSIGEKAKDLDFFVHGGMSVEEASELLGVEMKMLGEEKYVHSPFYVMEGVWEGETIQVIFTKTPTSEYIKHFPANCSKIWYTREGGFDWDNSFNHFRDLNVVISYVESVGGAAYFDKLMQKGWFRTCHHVWSRDQFLRELGSNLIPQPAPVPAPVVQGLDGWGLGNGILVNAAGDWEGQF